MSDLANKLTFEFPNMNPKRRLRELILHIAKVSEFDRTFGKTKLAKILYFSDFTSFRLSGVPITGAKYVKLPNGPVPDILSKLLDEMQAEGDIEVVERPISGYVHPQMRVIARREPDYKLFSARDIAQVDEIIRTLEDMSGTDVAERTHGIMWHVLDMQEAIPYEAAIVSDDEVTEDDIKTAEALSRELGLDA